MKTQNVNRSKIMDVQHSSLGGGGAPIVINLDKTFFVIPEKNTEPFRVGDINPDMRLEHLDAFIENVSHNLEKAPVFDPVYNSMGDLIGRLAQAVKAKPELEKFALNLAIVCTIDPATQSMLYEFKIMGSV